MIDHAVAADVAAVTALWNEVIADTTITFTSTLKEEAEIADMIATQPLFVVRDTDVVGFATYSQFRGGDGYAHTMEHAIYLSKGARGCGFGKSLLAAVETSARSAGCHSLIAGISAENENGIAFHAAMGFSAVGRVPEAGRKFGRLIDLVLMQKHL